MDYKVFPKLKNLFKKSDNDNKNLVTKENFYGIDYLLIERNIKFLLKKFNEINIENKILLYQYGSICSSLKKIKELLKKKKIIINYCILWLCKYIIKKMNKDNSNK